MTKATVAQIFVAYNESTQLVPVIIKAPFVVAAEFRKYGVVGAGGFTVAVTVHETGCVAVATQRTNSTGIAVLLFVALISCTITLSASNFPIDICPIVQVVVVAGAVVPFTTRI